MEALEAGRIAHGAAGDNPFTASSPQEIASNSQNIQKNNSVSVGAVNVHTQATDAGAMAADSRQALQDELDTLISDNDDGLAY